MITYEFSLILKQMLSNGLQLTTCAEKSAEKKAEDVRNDRHDRCGRNTGTHTVQHNYNITDVAT